MVLRMVGVVRNILFMLLCLSHLTSRIVAFSPLTFQYSRSSSVRPWQTATDLTLAGLSLEASSTACTTKRTTSLGSSSSSNSDAVDIKSSDDDITNKINSAVALLTRAAETKSEESDDVVAALLDLEKFMRQQNKVDPTMAEKTLNALAGGGGSSWRLIFTTGTVNTQKRTGRINYFPIKATQSFSTGTNPWLIENGIYLGDFPVLKFKGDFDWTVQKSGVTKLTFDFTSILLLNFFDIQLKAGEAAQLGAKTGLGSEGNVDLIEKQGKRAFFNWISANEKIATARGGGGGLALWMRVDYEGGK